jgi:hypothetical protein
VPARIATLRDLETRRVLEDRAHSGDAGVVARLTDFGNYVIGDTYSEANEGLKGRVVRDIAAERGADPFATLLDIVINDDLRTILWPIPTDGDDESWRMRQELWSDPRAMIGGSDAGAHLDRMCGSSYTTRFIGDAIRGRQLVPMERAVQMLTSEPADSRACAIAAHRVGQHADRPDLETIGATPMTCPDSARHSQRRGRARVVNGPSLSSTTRPLDGTGTVLRWRAYRHRHDLRLNRRWPIGGHRIPLTKVTAMRLGDTANVGASEYGKPLDGVRILAAEQMQALPFATQLLARLGAEVIKVEHPVVGESGRGSSPSMTDPQGRSVGATYLRNNLDKRSVGIDLKSPAGRDLFLALEPNFDVVGENFKAGTMDRMGLGYDVIAAAHPQAIYLSISGFGNGLPGMEASPYKSWPAYASVVEAMSGIYEYKSGPDRPPTTIPMGAVGDISSALFGAIGVLAALRHRDRTRTPGTWTTSSGPRSRPGSRAGPSGRPPRSSPPAASWPARPTRPATSSLAPVAAQARRGSASTSARTPCLSRAPCEVVEETRAPARAPWLGSTLTPSCRRAPMGASFRAPPASSTTTVTPSNPPDA